MNLIKTNFTKEEILESGAWYGAGTIFIRLTATLNTFIVIYFLTLYEYGVFKLILSLVGIFQAFVLSGLDGVIRNEIAHYLKDGKQKNASRMFFEFIFMKGTLAVLVWIILLVFIETYF